MAALPTACAGVALASDVTWCTTAPGGNAPGLQTVLDALLGMMGVLSPAKRLWMSWSGGGGMHVRRASVDCASKCGVWLLLGTREWGVQPLDK